MPGTDRTACVFDRSRRIGFAEDLGKRPRAEPWRQQNAEILKAETLKARVL
jgi:hypothetical protein